MKGNPTISRIRDISDALNISVSELLTMRPEKATGVAIIDGQVYQVSKPAANVVQLPVYERYSDLREDIKELNLSPEPLKPTETPPKWPCWRHSRSSP